MKKLKDFFHSNLGRQCWYYFLLYIAIWIVHLIFISVITFFHLNLNHSIGTIADWIVDRGWQSILLSKGIVFLVLFHFLKLRISKYEYIKKMFSNSKAAKRKEFYVVYCSIVVILWAIYGIQPNGQFIFDPIRLFFSMISGFLFFALDLLFLLLLDFEFPLKKRRDEVKKIFLFPLFFYFFTSMTFVYEQNINFNLYSLFFILLMFLYWRRRNWTMPLSLILFLYVPMYSIFGLDPVWESRFSFFLPTQKVHSVFWPVLAFVIFYYLEVKKRINPEYIGRD